MGKIGKKTKKTALFSIFLHRQNESAIGKITKTQAEKLGYPGGTARTGSFCVIFLSSFFLGLAAGFFVCFYERRITYIMYTLGGLCIVALG